MWLGELTLCPRCHSWETAPAATSQLEPIAPTRTPGDSYRTDLLTLRDAHALRLASLRSGTSAYKTVSGILRGIQMSIDALERK